ncbi:hypothetical protein SLH49_00505 [Cognatiyoonia sp. IB215446]|uniref:hypothetical protein n=1 Tax=Cognatiyoonia sp. IB215446 TaxID=3097355 RepID=UPI002A1634A3|nr:hypothetical protein [Cognatiyoonia sp. IB215446]MDX8346455.1 hypothetical protein [Cognatiyoonia sp. IB215446]
MSRPRSPSYPNQPLQKCLQLISLVFKEDRTNPIDRETAAKHIGYSGLSGAADKTLSTLAQYGLLEKAGTGEVQVTSLAVEILHPDRPEDRQIALRDAINSPTVFQQISNRFQDGTPSKSALESWLVREGFQDRAISPIIRSYLESVRFLVAEGITIGEGDLEQGAELDHDSIVTDQLDNKDIGSFDNAAQQIGRTSPGTTSKPSNQAFVEEWFRVKLGSEKTVTINLFGAEDITARDIDKLIILLEAQKVAIAD